jgi:DNA-binding transcriptional MerR regulator
MTDTGYRLPNEVATQLKISPSTLRRWSNEFADYLSDSAGRPQSEAGSQAAHRRYSDEDLESLMTIKGLLAEGLTYIQVGRRLEALRLRRAATDVVTEDGAPQVMVLGPSLQQSSTAFPAVTVLADTLHTVADGQQMLLGSQQANRDLLTVVLQDNFSLKEENAKLRDRMLELERDLAEIRRLDATRRESLDARLRDVEEQMHQRPPQAQQTTQTTQTKQTGRPARQERTGCLAQLFGPMG